MILFLPTEGTEVWMKGCFSKHGTMLTPLSCLTGSAVDCSLCTQTAASVSKFSATVVIAKEVGVSAKDFSWPFMEQFALEHCIVLLCQDTTTFQDWTLAPCLLRTNIQDAHWHVVLRFHVFSRSHLKLVLVGSIWVTKCSTVLQPATFCCLQGPTVWRWMVPWTVPLQQCSWCSRPRMNVEGAGAARRWLLHLWMFAFLSPPEEHSKVDSFLQAGGDLARCMPNQLGKAFWRKDSNWASGIFGPCFYQEPSRRRNVWRQLFPYRVPQFGVPEMHHDAAREAVDVLRCHLIFLLLPMPIALYLCLHHFLQVLQRSMRVWSLRIAIA